MPNIPNTNNPGYLFVSAGSGQNQGYWLPLTDEKDYAIGGAIVVTTSTATLPPPHQLALNGQLISVTGVMVAGSLTADINQNGSAIPGLTSLAFNTTAATYSPTDTTMVAIGDLLGPVIDSVSSAVGLSLAFVYWKYL